MQFPLQGTGLCSYYMQKGICKFGSNCKFHHPNRSESEQEKLNADSQGSSQQNFYSILGDIIKPDPDLSLRHAPPPLDLPVPSYLLQQSSKGKEDKSFSLTQPRQVYSCPEQSGYQQVDIRVHLSLYLVYPIIIGKRERSKSSGVLFFLAPTPLIL